MKRKVVKRCQSVLEFWNDIFCGNRSDTKFEIEFLQDYEFTVVLAEKDKIFRICTVKPVSIGSTVLAQIDINEIFWQELDLTKNDSSVCDYSLVHHILDCIFSTHAMTDVVFMELWEEKLP